MMRPSLHLKAAAIEELQHFVLACFHLPGGLHQILGIDRIPVAATRITQTRNIEWLDCLEDVFGKFVRLLPGSNLASALEEPHTDEPKGRMVVQEKGRRQMGLTQPSRRFGKAGRSEIEQRQRSEHRKVIHVRVQASDQTRGCE